MVCIPPDCLVAAMPAKTTKASGQKMAEVMLNKMKKEREQDEAEKLRAKEAELKKELAKKALDEKVKVEKEKAMTNKAFPRHVIITPKSVSDALVGGLDHEDLWVAICGRLDKDRKIKEDIEKAMKEEAALWRNKYMSEDDGKTFVIKLRESGKVSSNAQKWQLPGKSTTLALKKEIIDKFCSPDLEVHPDAVVAQFKTKELQPKVSMNMLVENMGFDVGVHELKYKINFAAARLRLKAKNEDPFADGVSDASVSDAEQQVKKNNEEDRRCVIVVVRGCCCRCRCLRHRKRRLACGRNEEDQDGEAQAV